jgi:cytochrome P450
MIPINRMECPIVTQNVAEVDLMDVEIQECPYPAYKTLREEAPVYRDELTGFYVLTRYEDLREVLKDPATFSNLRPRGPDHIPPERVQMIAKLFREKGWLPAPTLSGRDNPEHKQMRALFDHTFRASRIKLMDPYVRDLSYQLVDAFIADGHCDWVRQFAVPMPLIIIGKQMGAPEKDIWRIKAWTDAWVKRLGLMQTDAEAIWSAEMEIEQQHYFQPIFEQLRREPNDTLLSELVNREIPEWGRKLNDNELHAEMTADTFVGGSETTTNALSAGIMLLAQNPDCFALLKSDPERYLRTFIEEVIRLEGPVQGLQRFTTCDVSFHGVTIPKGSVINVRYAAANRDPAHFPDPDRIDLERKNAATHLGFGSGVHHCLGAPLARRELWWGFTAFLERVEDFRLAPGKNHLRHVPNFYLRCLKELHIEFTPKKRPSH